MRLVGKNKVAVSKYLTLHLTIAFATEIIRVTLLICCKEMPAFIVRFKYRIGTDIDVMDRPFVSSFVASIIMGVFM